MRHRDDAWAHAVVDPKDAGRRPVRVREHHRVAVGETEPGDVVGIAPDPRLLAAAVVSGEPARLSLGRASTSSLVAFAYLLTFGSLIGFTAYVYLLSHTTAAKASTYAYVNPIVAVLLGWGIGHEPVSSRTLLAAGVILAGVAIITITRDPAPVTRGGR